jgi:ubiquinone/menaquinone biosynthesis C-methylase UbiE
VRVAGSAFVPPTATGITTARTLGNSHPTLLGILEPGMAVLDVGCGPGTLTAEIARRVEPGHVVGMDVNPAMVRAAEEANRPGEIANLVFYEGDIRESTWEGEFDVANTVRTLQWVPDPEVAIARMARAVGPGGRLVLRDFDHTRATWRGAPGSWTRFYAAFLAWRQAGGLDNAIARRLPALCQAAGLQDIDVTPQITTVRAGDADFFRVAGVWRMMIEGRGREMVATGHLTEAERQAAFRAYTRWMQEPGVTQTIHEACVLARCPREGRGRRRPSPPPGA